MAVSSSRSTTQIGGINQFKNGLKAYIKNHEFKRHPSKLSVKTDDRAKSFTGLRKSDVQKLIGKKGKQPNQVKKNFKSVKSQGRTQN